ncbi:hypothetical protein NKH18_00255 [Streptomyces sp. M10(2022)]
MCAYHRTARAACTAPPHHRCGGRSHHRTAGVRRVPHRPHHRPGVDAIVRSAPQPMRDIAVGVPCIAS